MQYYIAAFEIATRAHLHQKDIGGKPYIFHPITVSKQCQSSKAKIVALLHDVLEDSDITIEEIEREIPDKEILHAITLLTKKSQDKKGAGYVEYLRRIKADAIAREVKVADLVHNMDLSRLPRITERDTKRQDKYRQSLEFLSGACETITV